MIGLAPKNLTRDHTTYLVSLNQNAIIRKPRYKIGETLRIRKKIETFQRGFKLQFSHEVFRIEKILTYNPPAYRLVSNETEAIILGRFYAAELVKYRAV